ncbi:MAG: VCBS repeat-containing protein [Lewinellaceae bacterium]|nr:VCBS repeat-containing protein [Saprospiraceae bacterium]MCB9308142.1 VCBS repeat-containing protein [Lewinellaceae bacterium]MCB9354769.1 VCBS repeat-containing protein [Lewinellaceae bacterium]
MHFKQHPVLRRKTYFLFFLFAPFFLYSQSAEICDNGIDDDGDGLIDCYDQDCTCTGQCDDFYYTTCNADCYYIPPCGQISLGVQWTAEAETGTYSTLAAGDMDGDGIPDVVTYRVEAEDIFIIDGATGATKVHIVAPTIWPGGTAPAIADLDHDGFGELVMVGFDRLLYCYEHDGTLKYTSAAPVGFAPRYRFAVPNIADFDHDGWAEVNIGNQVFNGQTGALLASGGANVSAGEHPARVAVGFSFASPVAMDVLPDSFCPDCAGLEIVAGNQVLSVNLNTGAVTPVVTAPPEVSDGFTSIADFDGDGDLDAIVQGQNTTTNFNTIYCWDLQTSTILRQFKLLNNWQEGASRVNIADLNGDGNLEVSFVSYPRLYALRNNFTIMWTRTINDASSITCSSVFDFCGDGSADIVYRDQDKLRVINGASGQISWEDVCTSATHIENPLVLDVDADGQTEIVIECGSDPNNLTAGTVVAYEAVGTPGIASRQVWNQHAYFNTNINDDLSVPRYQQNPHIIGDSLKMNTFMNQFFNPTFPSPDGVLSLDNVSCDRDSLVLSVTLCNTGDNLLPPQTPVSAYIGNPQAVAAQWLGAVPLGFDLKPDSCRSFTFRIPRVANDSVFIVLNDDSSLPAPYSLSQDFPVTAIGECGFTNNIASFYYAYQPDAIELGQDTAICDNTTIPLDVSGNDLVGWQWTDGTMSATYTVPDAGTYGVTVTDICGITQTDEIIVTIDSSTVVYLGEDQALCAGEMTSLSQSGFDFYNWSGNGLSCSNCPDVTISPSTSGFVILQAGFANGCVNTDTMYLAVRDTFNYAVDTTICYGRTVLWNGEVIPPDSNRTFYLQTIYGCDSTVHVRVHGTQAGTFNIQVDTAVCLGSTLSMNGAQLPPGAAETFYLSAVTGCDSTVFVTVAPKDTFSTAESRAICAGESSLIFGQNQNASGTYRQTFMAKNGCDSTHTVQLTVFDPITLEVDGTPACFNEATGALWATAAGSAPPFDYSWSVAGANGPEVDELPAGNYSVTVTDANDCTETADAVVSAYPPILFSAISDSASCFGVPDGSITITSPDSSLLYSLDGDVFAQNLYYGDLTGGLYDVYAQDIYGCIDTLPIGVLQPPQLAVVLPADTTLRLGDSLDIFVQTFGLGPFTYAWSDSFYLSCSDCPNPVSKPLSDVRYYLTVTDKNGCTTTEDLLLEVEHILDAYIPNVFAPLSSSDQNSRFELNFGPAAQRVRLLRVFDRWGNLMYELKDAAPNDNSRAWDGRHRGKLVMPGVYTWMLQVELVDGSILKYHGDLTIVR